MTTAHSNVPSRRSSPYSSSGVSEAEIDQAIRGPVRYFAGWAVFWLVVSSVFALVASLKLHWPGFLDGIEVLTYGRVEAVASNAFFYGWASCAVFAAGVWLMARLSQVRLGNSPLLYVAGAFWNIGLLLGLGGILTGWATGYFSYQLPEYTAPILLISYALIGAWGVYAFHSRQYQTTFTSQWYLLAAFFWFPWIYSAAHTMLIWAPVRGTVQSIVEAWYSYNFFALWLAPVALAFIYYFLPKILGRPIRYYYLAKVGFWTYALLAPWIGVSTLSSGPVPAWVPTAGIVCATLILAPVAILSLNWLSTLSGNFHRVGNSTSLTFILVAIAAFFVFHLTQTLTVFRSAQEVLQFTYFRTALEVLGSYAFFSMAAFGAFYFLLPRVSGKGWLFPNMIKLHFWCALSGLVLLIGGLAMAGWVQGAAMLNPDTGFAGAGSGWLTVASLGWIVLLVGHAAFAWNILALLTSSRPVPAAVSEALLATPPEMKVQTQST